MSVTNETFFNVMVNKDGVNADLLSYFFSQRVIWFFQGVNSVSAHQLCMQLLYLGNLNSKPIYINLQSPGGSVYACLSIINTMMTIKAPIHVTGCGFIASAGAVMLICGTKGYRSALQNSRIMLHQAIGAIPRSSLPDLEITYKEYQYLNEILKEILFTRINVNKEEFELKMTRDWYLSSEEALAAGVIDKIIYNFNEVTPPTTPIEPVLSNVNITFKEAVKINKSDNTEEVKEVKNKATKEKKVKKPTKDKPIKTK